MTKKDLLMDAWESISHGCDCLCDACELQNYRQCTTNCPNKEIFNYVDKIEKIIEEKLDES